MTLYYLTKDPAAGLPNDWRIPGADPTQPPLPGGVGALAYRSAITGTIPPGGGFYDFFFGGGVILAPWYQVPGARGRITGMLRLDNTGMLPTTPYFTLLFNGASMANLTPSIFTLTMPPVPSGGLETYKFEVEFCFTEAGVIVLTTASAVATIAGVTVIPDPTAGPYFSPIVPGPQQTISFRLNATNECSVVFGGFLAQLQAGEPIFNSF